MRRALPLAIALALVAGDGLAATARWQKHWRKRSHAPPLPHPELLHPRDMPPYPTGFVFNVVKRGADVGAPAHVVAARPRDVADRLAACWRPPAAASRQAREITLRLQFARTGAVIGEAKVTYVRTSGEAGARAQMMRSIRSALADCVPLRFTPSLGNAIAGYPFAIRFIAAGAED